MWVNIRTFDGKQKADIQNVSKLTKIEDLRIKIAEVFDAPISKQQLYYGGKLLVDGHSLFDYNIGHGQTIQMMIRLPFAAKVPESSPSKEEIKTKDFSESDGATNKENLLPSAPEKEACTLTESKYFKVGDLIDAKSKDHGAWFEAKIVSILKFSPSKDKVLHNVDDNEEKVTISPSGPSTDSAKENDDDENILYSVTYNDYDDEETLPLDYIRPRARRILKFEEICPGDSIMVNYNIEDPDEQGFWYDCIVTQKESRRKTFHGTILIGLANAELQDCKVKFIDGEVFAIEKTIPLCDRNFELIDDMSSRHKETVCRVCKSLENARCKKCGCSICGGKEEPEKLVLCDECDLGYHIWCLSPPLTSVPDDDEWYCPKCKNDANEVVKPGEKLKVSKKKSKMASHSSTSTRDWGKGMACAGRTTQCTIVPSNHFGPIPGVEVGTMWKFRLQVSESGVHRPHVSGIHGRESEGAFSIVLSGGYAEDEDNGSSFTYTGSGGRDLSGNKREAKQSQDQTLTRMNKALALSCVAPFNKSGAEAKDWKKGKPVRVVRNFKGAKHSKYAPKEGNRYDGIYKVAKYWPEKGKSGFIVWRYLFYYDDSAPLPWTKAGQKRAKELGLTMQFPAGYVEPKAPEKKGKRPLEEDESVEEPSPKKQKMKKKKVVFQLPEETNVLINKDSKNKKIWEECLKCVPDGNTVFLNSVTDQFNCICCQELVFNPVSLHCGHNICKKCLKNSFKAEVYSCPVCRADLAKKTAYPVNEELQNILLKLFPGYNHGR